MSRSVIAALHVVTSPGSDRTHLCASSPAIPGTSPDQLPERTLCGLHTGLRALTLHVAAVGCLNCLAIGFSHYLELPAWATGPSTLPPTHPSKS